MKSLLSYLPSVVDDSGYLAGEKGHQALLVGHYHTAPITILSLDHKPYKTAAAWFADTKFEDWVSVKNFTDKYGLLRSRWIHEAWAPGYVGDTSRQFYVPIEDFIESHRQFVEHFQTRRKSRDGMRKVTEWISKQLGTASELKQASVVDDMPKLFQPRIGLEVSLAKFNGKEGIQWQLVVGDLWQALCYELAEIIGEQNKWIRVCKNCGRRFVTANKRTIFCDNRPEGRLPCSKLYHNRKWAAGRRRRLKREARKSCEVGM